MEENVFDSLDAIDAALDKEFGEVANEPEVEVQEEQIAEPTDVEDEKKEEEIPQEVEEPKEQEEIEKPQDEGSKEDKKNHAFAELRAENGNLKKERDDYKADSDYLKELAASYGYTDVSKFQEAIREAKYQKEAQEKGYDIELYRKYMEQEQRIAQIEKERDAEIQNRKLERFKDAVDSAVSKYGVEEQEIFDRLENEGISADEILNLSNPRLLIDGVLKDKIQNNAKQAQIDNLQNLKTLAEGENEQSGTVPQVTIESLLKDDLDAYKKLNYFE